MARQGRSAGTTNSKSATRGSRYVIGRSYASHGSSVSDTGPSLPRLILSTAALATKILLIIPASILPRTPPEFAAWMLSLVYLFVIAGGCNA